MKCPYCLGTDVEHELGEPCYFEQQQRDLDLAEEERINYALSEYD